MKIKQAVSEDWGKVRALFLELLKTDPGAFVDEYEEIASRPESKWREGLENKEAATFVAIVDSKFVGMGRINFYPEIPGVPVLHKLGVLPEYRGQGIAKRLVKEREKWAKQKGANKIRLYIVADRLKTIEFSRKNGYVEKELLKNNVEKSDGTFVDVVIMEKELA